MDIRRLEAFLKVYELGSFSKAGQELFLSQPTISAHVSSLEQELGVPLFDRLGRTVLPTQAGEVLHEHVREIFASLDNARAEIRLLQDQVAGDLIIGASTIPAHYLLPQVLGMFMAEYPEVRVDLRVSDSSRIVEQVSAGEFLLGVVGAASETPELAFVPVMRDELVVIAKPGMVPEREMSLARLLELPFVARERGSGTRTSFESHLARMGASPSQLRVALTVESTFGVVQCVRAGIGVGVTSRLAARDAVARGELTAVTLSGAPMRRDFYLVHHEKRRMFPAMRAFMDFLRNSPVTRGEGQ